MLALKELWHRRVLVALSAVFAALVAAFAVYSVSVLPPSLSQRSDTQATGSIEILVDSARSPIADARRDLSGLTARAGVFARMMGGGDVVHQIAEEAGIPFKRIEVSGATPLPGEAPGAEAASTLNLPYGIMISQPEGLPILDVETRAPRVGEALALASAAPTAIFKLVRSVQLQQGTPPQKRVEFRPLGPPEAALEDDALGGKVALAIFLFVLALCIALVLAAPRFLAAWREAEPGAEAPERTRKRPRRPREAVDALRALVGGEPGRGTWNWREP